MIMCMFFVLFCLIVMPDHLPQFRKSFILFISRPVHLPWVIVIVPPAWYCLDVDLIMLLLVANIGLLNLASIVMLLIVATYSCMYDA